jgi:hypothetical protein
VNALIAARLAIDPCRNLPIPKTYNGCFRSLIQREDIEWLEQVKSTALALIGVVEDDSLSTQLLADIRDVFAEKGLTKDDDGMRSAELVAAAQRSSGLLCPPGIARERRLSRDAASLHVGERQRGLAGESTPNHVRRAAGDLQDIRQGFRRLTSVIPSIRFFVIFVPPLRTMYMHVTSSPIFGGETPNPSLPASIFMVWCL